MTASRAPADPDVLAFETTVERIDGTAVELAETYFYPESGGQPADRGTIADIAVTHVETVDDDDVVHHLAEEPPVTVGETVACSIDPTFRTYCMRAHTASHVLYGAARRCFDDLGYAGFDIGTETIRVDLTTADPIDEDDLIELERLSNRAVWDALPVTWETMPAEEARALPDIAFNERTEEGAMADRAASVRVVTIEGWDTAACGGTHVSNTREIGPIELIDRSNPGEGRTRIEFAVGPTGIDHRATVHRAARAASRAADASVADLPAAVDRLREETDELAAEVASLREAVLSARIADLETVDASGSSALDAGSDHGDGDGDAATATWAVGTIDDDGPLADVGPNDLQDPVEDAVGTDPEFPDVVAVVGADGTPFVVVATTGEASLDAGGIVDTVTDEFGGGGGGSRTFAQGGGLDAEPAAVVEFLRSEATALVTPDAER
ncbi:alanyl-tRNA editing protein [Halopenitus sp. POP-27]|uniref:alanyl-tRNA editing protein n=1 Tax=Halopenitus sp. POP-27 TaxID=2994425 RepID=UPI0024686FFC|nr:alanyl-tRNA editing protein [Halopenitus sp. POP-27]